MAVGSTYGRHPLSSLGSTLTCGNMRDGQPTDCSQLCKPLYHTPAGTQQGLGCCCATPKEKGTALPFRY
eukprot:1159341-Pelagomonas_calceolata.AAC.5